MGAAAQANPNGNPFDTPLNSEMQESQQRQDASQQQSSNGNPFDEPLASEKAEAAATTKPDPAIPTITTATNPKLAAAMAGKDMPEYVGAVGAAGAGLMGAGLLDDATAPVIKHLATEYGEPLTAALKNAAEQHPIISHLLKLGLANAATMKVAEYMHMFGKH